VSGGANSDSISADSIPIANPRIGSFGLTSEGPETRKIVLQLGEMEME